MKNLLRYLPIVAGILLGALFLFVSLMFFFGPPPPPEQLPPAGTPAGHFMAALGPTHYMAFVKVFELVGGATVMIPRLRNFGLLLLTPVIVNIVAFHALIGDPKMLLHLMTLAVVVLALYLLWVGRRSLAGLFKA